MESAYEALVWARVDVDGYSAPYGMRGIVKSCAKDLEAAFAREGVKFDLVTNLVTGRSTYAFACGDKPCANAAKAIEIARKLASSNGKGARDAANP